MRAAHVIAEVAVVLISLEEDNTLFRVPQVVGEEVKGHECNIINLVQTMKSIFTNYISGFYQK